MRVTAIHLVLGLASTLLPRAAAAAEEASTPADRAAAEADAPAPGSPHLAVRAWVGGGARSLYDVYFAGGDMHIGAGVDTPSGTFGLACSFFGGVIEGGLPALQASFGFYVEWPVGPLRFGFEPRVGYLGIERVTNERQFGAYTFGVAGHATVDLVRKDGVAFALGVEPTVDVAAALGNDGASRDGAAPLLGATAIVQVRYRYVER